MCRKNAMGFGTQEMMLTLQNQTQRIQQMLFLEQHNKALLMRRPHTPPFRRKARWLGVTQGLSQLRGSRRTNTVFSTDKMGWGDGRMLKRNNEENYCSSWGSKFPSQKPLWWLQVQRIQEPLSVLVTSIHMHVLKKKQTHKNAFNY